MIYEKKITQMAKDAGSFDKLRIHVAANDRDARVLNERKETSIFQSQAAFYKGCGVAYEINGTSSVYLTVVSDNENRTKRVFDELCMILFGG